MIDPDIFFLDVDRFMEEIGFPLSIISFLENRIPLCFYKSQIQSIFILLIPTIDEYMIIHSISHEYTHHVLCELEGLTTSRKYDNVANMIEFVCGLIPEELINNPNLIIRR